ncbi:MAG: hypothetical protein ACFHVJ_01180 [Aestuariibacter sp.]
MRGLYLCCMLLTASGLAQTVAKDPTRPPKYKSPAALAAEANAEDSADAGAIIEEQVVEGVTFPRAKLSAIFYSDIVRYAILNNEIVNEGDSWNNAVLARVLPDRIVLQRENKQREIMLNETKIIIEKSYDN